MTWNSTAHLKCCDLPEGMSTAHQFEERPALAVVTEYPDPFENLPPTNNRPASLGVTKAQAVGLAFVAGLGVAVGYWIIVPAFWAVMLGGPTG